MKRALLPSAALLWGLQISFLSPSLALVLVALLHATAGQVGWLLAAYNASAFLAAVVVPRWADRHGDYLRPMAMAATFTVALTLALAVATTVPLVLAALVVLGGPAGVGVSMFFAQVRHEGATNAEVVNARALVSVAWVAGPPLATLILGASGSHGILAAIAAVALLNLATTMLLLRVRRRGASVEGLPDSGSTGRVRSRWGLGLLIVAFVAMQGGNSANVAIMGLFVSKGLGLPVWWAGVILGVAAGLEVPALILIGRLSRRYSSLRLIATGTVAGTAYYLVMTLASGSWGSFGPSPWVLVAAQALNAWFYATVAGAGLTLFQEVIPRPGAATGAYSNAARLGAVASGPVIATASLTSLGYGSVFAIGAVTTILALILVVLAARAFRGSLAG